MKAQIHPEWYPEAKFICAGCNTTYIVGSTRPEIRVEVCGNCHPFYTGTMRYVDVAGRVDKFRERQQLTKERQKLSKTERRAMKRKKKLEEELSKPTSLEDLRK